MRLRSAVGLAIALVVTAPAAPAEAQGGPAVDWSAIEVEAMAHFKALLRIDTSNPPGNESEAAAYLRGVLEREGIATELFALDPARANLVARIEGNGNARPILVMAHTDVVGAQPENWSVDPFAAVTRDGYVYGRGALDDKDNVTAGLMLMLILKRTGVALDRDINVPT
jgi:acetylornithine deacetylase/succinyl-diaminopimelate desuccinylase-like protein